MIFKAEVFSIRKYPAGPAFLALDYIMGGISVEGHVPWQKNGRFSPHLEPAVTLRADQHRFFNMQSA